MTTIKVTGIEKDYRIYEFIAVLTINGTTDDQSTMEPIKIGTMGNLTYMDLGDEKLSIGDSFKVDTVPGKSHELIIIYLSNGNMSGSVEWET